MRCLLIQMEDCGSDILTPNLFSQPIKAVPAPVIQFAFVLDTLHLFGSSCHNTPDCPDLVMTYLTDDTRMFNPVLDSFGAVLNAIGKLYQFPVQMCTVFISIGLTVRSMWELIGASLLAPFSK